MKLPIKYASVIEPRLYGDKMEYNTIETPQTIVDINKINVQVPSF